MCSTSTELYFKEAHGAGPWITEIMGNLAISSLLIQEAMTSKARFQISLESDGLFKFGMVDVFPGTQLRCRFSPQKISGQSEKVKSIADVIDVESGMLMVSRSIEGGKEAYRSRMRLNDSDLNKVFQQYLADSEQIVSVMRTGVVLDMDGRVTHAGGVMVIAMPDCDFDELRACTHSLEMLPPMEHVLVEEHHLGLVVSRVVGALPLKKLSEDPVKLHCLCSYQKVLAALPLLGKEVLNEMVEKNETAKSTCEYCKVIYEVPVDVLASIET
jgi:molecular chaperone Hsp33